MTRQDDKDAVRQVLSQFQTGYTDRDSQKVDQFMDLFSGRDDIELIGIGAAVRGGQEWFQGPAAIRDILLSDWEYWGDVLFDVESAQITVEGHVAWVSMTGVLVQTDTHTAAMGQYATQMKELLRDNSPDPDADMLEAVHYGIRRLWERRKGAGHAWPFVLTAVLVQSDHRWQFHTVHWSMPVE